MGERDDLAALRRENAELRRRCHVQQVLAHTLASGTGLAGVVDAVHRLTGRGVAAENTRGTLRAWAGPRRPRPYPVAAPGPRTVLLERLMGTPGPVREDRRLVVAATVRGEVLGTLVLWDVDGQVREHDELALCYGALLLAAELDHVRGLADHDARLRRDLVEDLLAPGPPLDAVARAEALGHHLHRPHRVLVLRWPAAAGAAMPRAVKAAVLSLGEPGMLVVRRPGGVVVVAPAADTDRAPYQRLHDHVVDRTGAVGVVGVGSVVDDPASLARSHAEARRAARVLVSTTRPQGLAFYEDLGMHRLLPLDDREMHAYVREWLGSLLTYDTTTGSELVRTLWHYLEQGGNADAAARALVVHRSTLRYRLRRIREISGHDLTVPDTRLNVHVATRSWRLLEAPS